MSTAISRSAVFGPIEGASETGSVKFRKCFQPVPFDSERERSDRLVRFFPRERLLLEEDDDPLPDELLDREDLWDERDDELEVERDDRFDRLAESEVRLLLSICR